MAVTYYYCLPGGGTASRSVTMTVGNEVQYSNGQVGDCNVIKKRRQITMSIPTVATVNIVVRYKYTYTSEYEYSEEAPVVQTWNDTLTILSGHLTASEYVDTYVRTTCTSADNDIPQPN